MKSNEQLLEALAQEAAEIRLNQEALRDFILSDEFDDVDAYQQFLLQGQESAMSSYFYFLALRIDLVKAVQHEQS